MSKNLSVAIKSAVVAAIVVGVCFTRAQQASAGEWGETLKQLHHAHKLLSEADHDYDGHRAKAAELVHSAIKEIDHHGKFVVDASPSDEAPTIEARAESPREPQLKSDRQLREAKEILERVQGELSSHPKAVEHIGAAIAEINTALRIK